MPRRSHPPLDGLKTFGTRLRDLRLKAGLSQMKLARGIGFDPTHGYKYVLRLEKGLVPNPTLRTIAAYIEACSARWTDIADVMPSTGSGSAHKPATAAQEEQTKPVAKPAVDESPATPPRASQPLPARRDPRPVREQLRAQRLQEKTLKAQRFWASTRKAEDAVWGLLHAQRVISTRHRDYVAFTRASCSVIDTHSAARPDILASQLAGLVRSATQAGLDQGLLTRIQSICADAFRPDSPAR